MAHAGKNLVCGFDVSGQELRMEMFDKNNKLKQIGTRMVWPLPDDCKTRPDSFDKITDTMARMVHEATRLQAPIESITVGAAMPARFMKKDGSFPQYEDGSANVQQRLSGIHMGKSCWEKDWAATLQEKITAELGDRLPAQSDRVKGQPSPVVVTMLNDTGAQLLAVLEHAKKNGIDISAFKNGKIACIAPGSGAGASIAEVGMDGKKIRIRHNAHMYDAMVAVSSAQVAKLKKIFGDDYEVVVKKAQDFANIPMDKQEAFGSYFPLMKDGKKQLYLIEDQGQKHILPARFFAAKDGFEHLLGVDSEGMKKMGEMGVTRMNQIDEKSKEKLGFIGELMGEYFVQQDAETLRRVPFQGSPPIAYDEKIADDKKLKIPTKAILLAGGGMRDEIGAVIQESVEGVIAEKGSETLKVAHVYRPDVNFHKGTYNICETAAKRAVELSGLQLSVV